MRHYSVEYTDDIPAGFGGVTRGPFIRILKKYRHDQGLLEHEKTHVRQWWAGIGIMLVLAAVVGLCGGPSEVVGGLIGLSAGAHPVLYLICRPYRQWAEVRAYRIQLGVGRYASPSFAVDALVNKYNLRLTAEEARRLLRI